MGCASLTHGCDVRYTAYAYRLNRILVGPLREYLYMPVGPLREYLYMPVGPLREYLYMPVGQLREYLYRETEHILKLYCIACGYFVIIL